MTQSLKVEWKCVFWDSGGQCVITPGITPGIPIMQLWSAGSLD